MHPLLLKDAQLGSTAEANGFNISNSLQIPQQKKKTILLLLDGHYSHKSIEVIDFARQNHISVLSFPPHCTHRMQPLGMSSFFLPLKRYYNTECDKWMGKYPGRRITYYDIAGLFGKAYVKAATLQNASAGFLEAGICPFDDNKFTDSEFVAADNLKVCLINIK